MDWQHRPIIFIAHSVGGIVLKYVCTFEWFFPIIYFLQGSLLKALIHASQSHKGHLADHKEIELSTYGIFFLGIPHQGSKSFEFYRFFLQIQGIYSQTNDVLVRGLQADSQLLVEQLSQFTPISGLFDTKFFFEAYPTHCPGGYNKWQVPYADFSDSISLVFSWSRSLLLWSRGWLMSKRSQSTNFTPV